jgi:phosphoglucosamine mutase
MALFGTDGIRGTAGRYPLDRATVRRIGAALVRTLPRNSAPCRILAGRDTRESGAWIERDLAAGAAGAGAVVDSIGVVPTPAVAYLTSAESYDVGVMISASHNPFQDNGIKVFSGRGRKFSESVERRVEEMVADGAWQPADHDVPASPRADLALRYVDHLRAAVPDLRFDRGFRLVVDCAHGSTSPFAAELFRDLGLGVTSIGADPDGRNINAGCGSTHPALLARAVVESGADAGVAFDGDGDRAIFVDGSGRVVDGDAILFLCARQLLREGRLRGREVVATVMSNIGLELALRELGVGLVRCAVGDKYVMEEMLARELSLGGEQSGHVIFADYLFTGDGMCTALNVLRIMAITGQPLAQLASGFVSFPQVLLNVPVRERADLSSVPAVADAIHRVEARVAGKGRLLVRYSGTEPLLRVMLEGQHEEEIRAWAQEIVDIVDEHLGSGRP